MPNVMSIDEPVVGEKIVQLILRDNPHLARGDNFSHSAESVKAGQVLTDARQHDSTWTTTHCEMLKLPFPLDRSQLFTLSIFKNKKFIHYFKCTRHPLLNKDGFEAAVGDEVDVIDPITKRSRRVIATDRVIERTRYVIFRFAAS